MAPRDPLEPLEFDRFRDFDAAYVFGALSTEDRSAYEAHLPTCADCRRALAELAGLPGLLARVPVEQVIDESHEEAPPSLLPRLLTEAARERRRLRLRTIVGGLVAAACIVAAVVLALAVDRRGDRSRVAGGLPATSSSSAAASTSAAPQLPMQVVAATSLRATAAVTSVAWGTKVEMRCTYPATSGSPDYVEADYQLRAILRDGTTSVLATWNAVAGKTLRIEGDSSALRADFSSVQVTDLHGAVLLELPV
ncbi:MAG: putative transrane anti-sigma factor [Pseudonocardiales bacterium]|nr:putative transrane anti-sigma factor [Pseudonocardiales bacterium]